MLLADSEGPAGGSDLTVLVSTPGCVVIVPSTTAWLHGGVPSSFPRQNSMVLGTCVTGEQKLGPLSCTGRACGALRCRPLLGAHLLGLPRPEQWGRRGRSLAVWAGCQPGHQLSASTGVPQTPSVHQPPLAFPQGQPLACFCCHGDSLHLWLLHVDREPSPCKWLISPQGKSLFSFIHSLRWQTYWVPTICWVLF